LDTFEFWHMANFLRDLHQSGSLDSADLPLGEIGSREFIRKLLEGIAWRKGIGDLLAEGCARAADQITAGWESCGKYFPAYGSAAHGPLRNNSGVALLWALDSRCPVVDQHSYIRMSISFPNEPPPFTLPVEKARAISRRFYGSESAIDPATYEQKPEAAIQTQDRAAVINLLVLCDWIFPNFHSFVTPDRQGDLSLESQLLAAATGHELNEEELTLVGERVWNLSRAIMIREGRTREQDTLHDLFFQESKGQRAVSRQGLEKAKDRYYELRGWDEKRGWPKEEKLRQLKLEDVADDLARENLLP
jgi:aldehyde:ferredoxin oxidoreductase